MTTWIAACVGFVVGALCVAGVSVIAVLIWQDKARLLREEAED